MSGLLSKALSYTSVTVVTAHGQWGYSSPTVGGYVQLIQREVRNGHIVLGKKNGKVLDVYKAKATKKRVRKTRAEEDHT